jgi:DNA polymerase
MAASASSRRLDVRCFFANGSNGRSLNFHNHETLVESMQALKGDPLETTGSRVVTFRGNPKAKIMVIGEAPGAEEDRQGKPFVGKSGQLLDNILGSVGFAEDDVYITNMVKRRPPNNRTPLKWEILAYKPWIAEEIRLVDPHVIMLVGRVSAQTVLRSICSPDARLPISQSRGNWYEHEGKWLMPIFHPAYLLRNPQKTQGSPKALTWQDIQSVKLKMDEFSDDE